MTLKREILDLFNILAAPAEVYEELNQSPRWRAPFFFLLISSVLIGWFMIPVIMEPMKKIMTSSFGEGAAEEAIKGVMKSMLIMQLLLEPSFRFVRWLVFTGILYLLSVIFVKGDTYLFKRLFSVVAYTETIFIFMGTLTLLIIYAKGWENIENVEGLTVFKGLDFFLKDKNSNPALTSILSEINPFSIWYVITISVGMSIINKIDRLKSLGVVSISWMIWITLSIVRLSFTKLIMEII